MSLVDLLPFGLAPQTAIAVLAGLAAAASVVGVWLALVPRQDGAQRAREIVNRRRQLRADAMAGKGRTTQRALGLMQQTVKRLNLMRLAQADQLARKLSRAGLRQREAVTVFLFAKLVTPFAGAAAAPPLATFLGYPPSQPLHWLALLAGGAAVGYLAPDVFLRNLADRRKERLRLALPDALDLLVICAEAGLSLEAALTRVSREMSTSSPDIADEFGLTAIELGFLPERRQALENLRDRADLPGLRGLVNALIQTEKYGTPLAVALRVLSAELRHERLAKAEEKAAQLPALLTVPMILFILPPLFVVLMGPGVLRLMDAF